MKKINEVELQELFNRLKEKDEDAYEELYQKYSSLVYQIAFSILKNRENAEDIMQNVFVKIGKLSEDKLPSKYEASWLYSVTKNETISFLRRNKETLPMEEYIKKEQEDEIEELMQKDAYEKMIDSLEQKEKQIVSLKVETGLSFKEIASLLNMPIGTVQWKYYKSLHSLKLLIGNLSLVVIATTLCITKFLSKEKKSERVMEELIENKAIEEESQEKNRTEETKEASSKQDEIDSVTLSNKAIQDTDTVVTEEKIELEQGSNEQWQIEEKERVEENRAEVVSQTGLMIVLCCVVILGWIRLKKRNKKEKIR